MFLKITGCWGLTLGLGKMEFSGKTKLVLRHSVQAKLETRCTDNAVQPIHQTDVDVLSTLPDEPNSALCRSSSVSVTVTVIFIRDRRRKRVANQPDYRYRLDNVVCRSCASLTGLQSRSVSLLRNIITGDLYIHVKCNAPLNGFITRYMA